MKTWVLAMTFVPLALCLKPSQSRAEGPDSATARCQALASTDFSSIEDAPTEITAASVVEARSGAAAYCRVQGYIAPQVGFEIQLPLDQWNGKFMEVGCGGHCGTIWPRECAKPVHRGYACIATDMGHKGDVNATDGLWAYNNLETKIDWGFRATHVAAVAGKAITRHFYGQAPGKSYYTGCSTGGRQGMTEAQRFPWDFNGIIVGAPAINLTSLYVTFAWNYQASHDASGKAILSEEDLKLVHHAAVAQCDLDDGIQDGIIGNPLACAFKPRTLTCKKGQTSDCLSPRKVEAISRIYAGPTTSAGWRIYPGPAVGSEYNDAPNSWSGGWFPWYVSGDGVPSDGEQFGTSGFRYLHFLPNPGPGWQLKDFDVDRDSKRLGMMEGIYASTNPDLRAFKSAGGKLLVYQGMSDVPISPQNTVDYYETAQRTMGGRAMTQEFFRLFLLPGMTHCTGGAGAFDVDYLGALEAWVEKDQAPQKLTAAHFDLDAFMRAHDWKDPNYGDELEKFDSDPKNVKFTRPVFPYPLQAKYRGHGNPQSAESFFAVEPKRGN